MIITSLTSDLDALEGAVYDPNGEVANAGGIPAYVEMEAPITSIKIDNEEQTITNKTVNLNTLLTSGNIVTKTFGVAGDIYVGTNIVVAKNTKTISIASRLLGDVDNNGTITDDDADLVEKYIVGSATLDTIQKVCSDVYLDGEVDVSGAVGILKIVAGTYTQPYKYCTYVEDSDVSSDHLISDISIDGVYGKPFGNGIVALYSNTQLTSGTNIAYTITLGKTITNTTVTNEFRLLGDVNNKGGVDIIDASIIDQYINGTIELTTPQKICADVDTNGTINSTDANNITYYTVNKYTMPYKYCSYINDSSILKNGSLLNVTCKSHPYDLFAKIFDVGIIALYSNTQISAGTEITYTFIGGEKVATVDTDSTSNFSIGVDESGIYILKE